MMPIIGAAHRAAAAPRPPGRAALDPGPRLSRFPSGPHRSTVFLNASAEWESPETWSILTFCGRSTQVTHSARALPARAEADLFVAAARAALPRRHENGPALAGRAGPRRLVRRHREAWRAGRASAAGGGPLAGESGARDPKSTRLNSS